VEFDSPIYKAPSLPKISRRNISSPIIRGAQSVAAPRLRKSSFSFIKPRIQTPTLTSQVETSSESETISGNKVYETLVETNKILVEIQKQLALDFASRIVERKDIIRGKKRRAEKEKITRKEQSIESLNKFGSGVSKFFDKVTAPAKGIFQKLLDFFGIIVTGLVVNNAFNWLSDKNNQKKLSETLSFVGKYWKEIFGVLIGIKLISTIASLLTTIQLVSAVLMSPAFLAAVGTVITIASIQKFAGETQRYYQNLLKQKEKEKGRPLTQAEQEQAVRDQVTSTPLMPMLGGLVQQQVEQPPVKKSKGGTIPNLPSYNFKTSIVKQYQNITQKFSEGGTVGGAGSGLVDSVRTMLAPGEEVIRTSAAMMFRPLLKDINNNAGRMWITFSNAIRNMISYNETMRYALDELSRNLETFKKQLDDFVNQEKLEKSKKAGGGGYGLRTPSKDSITTLVLPTTIIHSDLKKPTRPATRTTIPITLPTKTANYKMPAIDGGMATDEPDISSVNLANDYMMLTPRMYGIFV
jgi:hypothetical protein